MQARIYIDIRIIRILNGEMKKKFELIMVDKFCTAGVDVGKKNDYLETSVCCAIFGYYSIGGTRLAY